MKTARAPLLAAALLAGMATTAAAGSLGGPLLLEDEGVFFVNGRPKQTLYTAATPTAAPEQITIGQLYVHYRIPLNRKPDAWPVVMVHGSGHMGVTYETTPDGREGWATYFTRRGIPVYVVDHSGRGRSGFDRSVVNEARATGTPPPGIGGFSDTRAWLAWFGPSFGVPFPDTQFPVEAVDQYFSQLVPNAESTLVGGGTNTVNALAALLDEIGPAILVTHSQSGPYGWQTGVLRPALVKAVLAVEPIGNCAVSNESPFAGIPTLLVSGDGRTDAADAPCRAFVDRIDAAGGTAFFLKTREAGLVGNRHMMMMEKNNLVIADMLLDWVRDNVPGAKRPKGKR